MVCLGKLLGHVRGIILGIILGMSGVSSWACLGHVWDNIWGILSTIDNNVQQSAVQHASVMPFFITFGQPGSLGNVHINPQLPLSIP